MLRKRGCLVPQPSSTAGASVGAKNLIRGEFITKGEMGWAVLCSRKGNSTLLVFRSDTDGVPYELAAHADRNYLQELGGGQIGFSREIWAQNSATILAYQRDSGGPKSPPMDHQGIEDAFLEKASLVWYFHGGKWMKLRGAD